jgi:hypothetical protein
VELTPHATVPAQTPAADSRPTAPLPPTHSASPAAQPATPAPAKPAPTVAPQSAPVAPKTPPQDKSAHWSSARMILVGQPAAQAAPAATAQPATATVPPVEAKTPVGPKPAGAEREPATIFVLPGPGGVVITSQDQQALDQFEDLFRSMVGSPSGKNPDFTIFYLKHAKAAAVAETLDGIFGGGTLSSQDSRGGGGRGMGGQGGDGGLFGGSLMGMSGGSTGSLRITPDSRLNALIAQGSPQDLDKIEQLLRVLDQQDSPEDVAIAPRPRIIPVYNTQASEVADLVKQIYADRIGSSSSGGSGQQRGSRFLEMMSMFRGPGGMMGGPGMMMGGPGGMMGGPGGMMGGMGGQSRRGGMFPGGGSRSSADEGPKMTIGVDTRSNNLIVVAPETLFEEVKQLVEDIDRSAGESTQAVKVVTLERTNIPSLQQALTAMTGGSVTSSSSMSTGASGNRQAGGLAGATPQRGGYIAPAPQSTGQMAAGMQGGVRAGGYGGGGGVNVNTGQQSASFGRGYGTAGGAGAQQGRGAYAARQGGAARSNQAYGGNGMRSSQAYGGVSSQGYGGYGGGAAAGGYGGAGGGYGGVGGGYGGARTGGYSSGGASMSGAGGMRSGGTSSFGTRSGASGVGAY